MTRSYWGIDLLYCKAFDLYKLPLQKKKKGKDQKSGHGGRSGHWPNRYIVGDMQRLRQYVVKKTQI